MSSSHNSYGTERELTSGGAKYRYHSIPALMDQGFPEIGELPISRRILLENLLHYEDGRIVSKDDIATLAKGTVGKEIAFRPARVLLQDFTGVPAVADLAAMRNAMVRLGGDPNKINPLQPADLVIDHSVQVDKFGTREAFRQNGLMEFDRNQERYIFLRWGQQAFQNFRVVPPETGIVHQVNLEYLGRVVFTKEVDGIARAYPDTLVGTDSHTTMINALGIVGWGVGGIEAEAAMLGRPISMLIPEVVGFRLTGELPTGSTATDLVLTVTQLLRQHGVVGKFVEFYGPALSNLTLPDRATIANMAPEYGATIGFFPVDEKTLDYLRLTGREPEQIELVEAYCKEQGIFVSEGYEEPVFSSSLELDLSTVHSCLAGPSRPQDRVDLPKVGENFRESISHFLRVDEQKAATALQRSGAVKQNGDSYDLKQGAVVIAAITSCTNTSNPSVLIAAGLLARNAVARGLQSKPWVKTSLAPGSKVVTEYLDDAGLTASLESLGFHLVGYGCTTCIGNSGPLAPPISSAIADNELVVAAVLSGNRNFEGRISPDVKASYLASPPLVVAYALAGTVDIDLVAEPIGQGSDGADIFLKDLWPDQAEIDAVIGKSVRPDQFQRQYADVFTGLENWRSLPTVKGELFDWQSDSTYIQEPPFFENIKREPDAPKDIVNARALVVVGDSVTTDHISPAGSIPADGPAGRYLQSKGVEPKSFNSFGSRRGNHEVMIRGTFANIRLRNELARGKEGGYTRHLPNDEVISIFEASEKYAAEKTPLIVVAGKAYGTGSSRDWAAKGTMLLGVRAVIAESYERIHRSNLVGMGVLPLQFRDGEGRKALSLDGTETFSIHGIAGGVTPGQTIRVTATRQNGSEFAFDAVVRIDTPDEIDYYNHGGILSYVLRSLL